MVRVPGLRLSRHPLRGRRWRRICCSPRGVNHVGPVPQHDRARITGRQTASITAWRRTRLCGAASRPQEGQQQAAPPATIRRPPAGPRACGGRLSLSPPSTRATRCSSARLTVKAAAQPGRGVSLTMAKAGSRGLWIPAAAKRHKSTQPPAGPLSTAVQSGAQSA